jgi:hypothetical protein
MLEQQLLFKVSKEVLLLQLKDKLLRSKEPELDQP